MSRKPNRVISTLERDISLTDLHLRENARRSPLTNNIQVTFCSREKQPDTFSANNGQCCLSCVQ